MTSSAIATVIKIMETLPEAAQNQIVEHLRDYVAEMQDEILWDISFKKSQNELVAAARRAKQEIAAGHAESMDYGQL